MKNHHLRSVAAIFLWVLSCCGTGTALADPVDFGDDKIPTRTIEFVDDNDLGGRIARFDGVVSADGQRLIVKGIDIMTPLVVHVLARDIRRPVDVSLHRYFWGKADAEGSTGSSGGWQFSGRAHDEVGIALSVATATPVYALVWQGPPVPAAPVPTLVIDSDRDVEGSGDAGGNSTLLLAIVGLLAVIVILLAFHLLRRRPGAAAILIAALSSAIVAPDEPAFAQSGSDLPDNPFVDDETASPKEPPPPNPFVDDEKPDENFRPEDPGDKPEENAADEASKLKPVNDPDKPGDKPDEPVDQDSKLKPGEKPDKPDERDSKLKPGEKPDKPEDQDSKLKPGEKPDKPDERDGKLKPDSDPDKPDGVAEGDAEARDGEADVGGDSSSGDSGSGGDRSFDSRLEDVYAHIRQLGSEIAANGSRIRDLEFLINQDREAVPEPGDGAPPISVSCDDNPDCQSCLARANDELSNLLINFDRLRIIYNSYMRYRDYMVGLGDSISGFHQLEQAAWYRVKLQIEEATINLQSTYDAKFDDYKGRLSDALATLSACDTVDGDPNFSRESVLFENYVKAKYARDE